MRVLKCSPAAGPLSAAIISNPVDWEVEVKSRITMSPHYKDDKLIILDGNDKPLNIEEIKTGTFHNVKVTKGKLLEDHIVETTQGNKVLHKDEYMYKQSWFKLQPDSLELKWKNGIVDNYNIPHKKVKKIKLVEGWTPDDPKDISPGDIVSSSLDNSQLVSLARSTKTVDKIDIISDALENFNLDDIDTLEFLLTCYGKVKSI